MKTFFNKYIKHIALVALSLGIFFGGVFQASAAWSYNGADILYTVSSNAAPSVDAGPDVVLTLPVNSTSVNGTASDSDGTITATQWSFLAGPTTPSISSTNLSHSSASVSHPSNITGMTVVGDYYFNFGATDNGGTATNDGLWVQVVPAVGSPSGTLSANDCTIAVSGSTCSTTVSWTTSDLTLNPTEITRNPNGPAPFTPSPLAAGSQATSVGNGVTTFYLYHNSVLLAQSTMNASCASGSSWNGSSCLATPPGTPSVTLNAAPASLFSGNAATLSWTSTNTTACTASATPVSGSWTGSRPTASSFPHESTGALTSTKTFTLTCTGPGGSAFSSKTVTVVPITSSIFAELTATPDRIASGESSVLSWTSANATSCSGIGFSTGGATSGSISVSPTVNTTYTLNCTNGSDSASDQASVLLRRKFLFIEF